MFSIFIISYIAHLSLSHFLSFFLYFCLLSNISPFPHSCSLSFWLAVLNSLSFFLSTCLFLPPLFLLTFIFTLCLSNPLPFFLSPFQFVSLLLSALPFLSVSVYPLPPLYLSNPHSLSFMRFLSICLCLLFSLSLSVCLSKSAILSVYLLSLTLFVCTAFLLSVCLSSQSNILSLSLSPHSLSVCLSLSPSSCLPLSALSRLCEFIATVWRLDVTLWLNGCIINQFHYSLHHLLTPPRD